MQVKVTPISETKFKLAVTADVQFLDVVKQQTLRHMGAKHVKLPGFRAGKAPLNLVEKQVNQQLMQQEFLEEAINRLYGQAIQAERLRPISQPQVNITKFVPFNQLEFTAEVEAVGEIKLANYKAIRMERPKVSIAAKEVQAVLLALQRRQAERDEVQRAARTGDELLIDFKGTDAKGRPINGADGQNYPLILGSGTFIPGFEPNLEGLKAGEEKTFNVTFPRNYNVYALQGKKVTFWVKVHKVSEIKKPKLDDAFAAKAGPFKTLADLKADIKKQLQAEAEQKAEREFEDKLINQIAAKSIVNVPNALIDDQLERAEQEERRNLAYRGQTWQEHLKEEGVTEEEHRQRNRPSAEASVKAGLVLSEIAERENLHVTPEELEVRIQLLKGQYKDTAMQAELDKPENRQDIANRLLTEKTIAKLKQYATKNS